MKAMILSQFHYGACLPEDATSCIDPYTDPIRQGISDDQVASIVEVAANLDRTVQCIDEAFRSTLQDKSSYITSVPGNVKCLEQDDENKNSCMAQATRDVLYEDIQTRTGLLLCTTLRVARVAEMNTLINLGVLLFGRVMKRLILASFIWTRCSTLVLP